MVLQVLDVFSMLFNVPHYCSILPWHFFDIPHKVLTFSQHPILTKCFPLFGKKSWNFLHVIWHLSTFSWHCSKSPKPWKDFTFPSANIVPNVHHHLKKKKYIYPLASSHCPSQSLSSSHHPNGVQAYTGWFINLKNPLNKNFTKDALFGISCKKTRHPKDILPKTNIGSHDILNKKE